MYISAEPSARDRPLTHDQSAPSLFLMSFHLAESRDLLHWLAGLTVVCLQTADAAGLSSRCKHPPSFSSGRTVHAAMFSEYHKSHYQPVPRFDNAWNRGSNGSASQIKLSPLMLILSSSPSQSFESASVWGSSAKEQTRCFLCLDDGEL